ncbi:DUF5067 domain-containing protein [Anaerofustis sp.]|uniref:DUF5067 domain-containing protein n=1 Tax=Anaerofustis sp. TaxID=1872517 RepID=UPI0025B9F9FC|nr:DUF5067 domain-containing protein [Anaerofustis sp.]
MKKVLSVLLVLVLGIGLFAGCGETEQSEYYFKDNVMNIPGIKIEITDVKIIAKGEKGNEYGEKNVIAFWYNTTKVDDTVESVDPMTAWISNVTAYQDNNENSVNELEVADLPDDKFLDSQMEEIKVGGTVENAVAYYLDDNSTPVLLRCSDLLQETIYGEQTFEVK